MFSYSLMDSKVMVTSLLSGPLGWLGSMALYCLRNCTTPHCPPYRDCEVAE